MFFLENLPKNLLNIQQEIKNKNNLKLLQGNKHPNSSIYKLKKLRGVGKELYSGVNSDNYIKELRDEW